MSATSTYAGLAIFTATVVVTKFCQHAPLSSWYQLANYTLIPSSSQGREQVLTELVLCPIRSSKGIRLSAFRSELDEEEGDHEQYERLLLLTDHQGHLQDQSANHIPRMILLVADLDFQDCRITINSSSNNVVLLLKQGQNELFESRLQLDLQGITSTNITYHRAADHHEYFTMYLHMDKMQLEALFGGSSALNVVETADVSHNNTSTTASTGSGSGTNNSSRDVVSIKPSDFYLKSSRDSIIPRLKSSTKVYVTANGTSGNDISTKGATTTSTGTGTGTAAATTTTSGTATTTGNNGKAREGGLPNQSKPKKMHKFSLFSMAQTTIASSNGGGNEQSEADLVQGDVLRYSTSNSVNLASESIPPQQSKTRIVTSLKSNKDYNFQYLSSSSDQIQFPEVMAMANNQIPWAEEDAVLSANLNLELGMEEFDSPKEMRRQNQLPFAVQKVQCQWRRFQVNKIYQRLLAEKRLVLGRAVTLIAKYVRRFLAIRKYLQLLVHQRSILIVTIRQAYDLIIADMFSDSDPYVVMHVERAQNHSTNHVFDHADATISSVTPSLSINKTAIIYNNLNPVWNTNHFAVNVSGADRLVCTMMDKDTFSSDEFMGQTVIDLKQYPQLFAGKKLQLKKLPVGNFQVPMRDLNGQEIKIPNKEVACKGELDLNLRLAKRGLSQFGWMLKQANNLINITVPEFKPRFFILSEGILSYYDNEQTLDHPRGSIACVDITVLEYGHELYGRKCILHVQTPKEDWYMQWMPQERSSQKQAWLTKLQYNCPMIIFNQLPHTYVQSAEWILSIGEDRESESHKSIKVNTSSKFSSMFNMTS